MSTGNDVKERVRNAIDIVELIGSHVPLQRKGRGYVGLCPWHDDSRPSLQVNQERQSWRCWVCNIGGDVFSFVMQQENVQFPEALRILAEKAGIPLARSGRKIQPGSADDKQTLYAAVAWAERQYHEQLAVAHEGQQARRYLHERGITDDSIKRYRLGYAPDAWQWLLDRASGEAITSQVLVAAGLAGISDTSGRSYDRFRQRVLFPIRDTQSRPVGFGGRILPGSDDPAKYVNSPESRLFSKSNLLYGLDVVRDAVTRSRELVVVEGYTDAIMAWQHGIDNAVAVLGTALGPRHVQVIKRFADRVILVLDGDEAGQRRSNEILQLFVASPIDLRIVTLPTGADPCDFLQQHGGEAFRRRLDEADDALSYKLRVATQGIDLTKDLHRANEALEEVLVTLAQVAPSRAAVGTSQQLRHRQTLAQVARIFQLAEPDLRQRIQALRSARSEPETAESPDSEAYKTVLAHARLGPRAVAAAVALPAVRTGGAGAHPTGPTTRIVSPNSCSKSMRACWQKTSSQVFKMSCWRLATQRLKHCSSSLMMRRSWVTIRRISPTTKHSNLTPSVKKSRPRPAKTLSRTTTQTLLNASRH